MRPLIRFIQRLLFANIGATGFGMLRAAWAATAFSAMLAQWQDVVFLYSDRGLLPPEILSTMVRSSYRFSLLTTVGSPDAVVALYWLLLASLLCALVGLLPRVSTITATVLLFSFHERDPFILGGGDTVLRTIGFLLCIAPELRAFSLQRLPLQWRYWKAKRTLLAPLPMPAWPMRLLLWQLIVLYGTSLWFKISGTMWPHGTAVAAALHHPTFSHLPKALADLFAPITTTITLGVLIFHMGWVALLIPHEVTDLLPARVPRVPWKRTLLLGGLFFHGGILLFMDAGCFSLAILSAYIGLLTTEDFTAIREACNRRFRTPRGKKTATIHVLYDGRCGLCLRSTFVLVLLDNLRRLTPVDFRNVAARRRVARDLQTRDLDRALHIRLPHQATYTGFDAFRVLARHLPALWVTVPFLYLPGVAPIGRRVYAHIASKRKQCRHGRCRF